MRHASKLRASTALAALIVPMLAQAHPGHAVHAPEFGLALGAGIAALFAAIRHAVRRATAASRR